MKKIMKPGLERQEYVEYYANLGAELCPHVGSVPLSELDFIGPDNAVECHACQLKNPVLEGEDVTKRWEEEQPYCIAQYETPD